MYFTLPKGFQFKPHFLFGRQMLPIKGQSQLSQAHLWCDIWRHPVSIKMTFHEAQSLRFSCNSQTFVWELQENCKDMWHDTFLSVKVWHIFLTAIEHVYAIKLESMVSYSTLWVNGHSNTMYSFSLSNSSIFLFRF